jgi:hypothetical protein
VGGKLTADGRGAIAVSRVLVRLGSLLPLLAAAASISNNLNQRRQTPLSHINLAKKLARATDFLAARVRMFTGILGY